MTMLHGFGDTSSSAELLAQVKAQSSQSNNRSSPSYCEGSSYAGESSRARSRGTNATTATTSRSRSRRSSRSVRSGSDSRSSSRRRRPSSRIDGGEDRGGGGRDSRRGSSNADKSVASRSTSKASRSTKTSRSTRTSSHYNNSASKSRSIDPDGYNAVSKLDNYDCSGVEDNTYDDFACSARSKKLAEVEQIAEVEKYSYMARKKASLMTNHDFERCENDHDDDDDSDAFLENDWNDQGSKSSRRRSRKISSHAKGKSDSSRNYNDGSQSRESRRSRSSASRTSSRRSKSNSKRKSYEQTQTIQDVDEVSIPMTVQGNVQPRPISPQSQAEDISHYMTGTSIGGTDGHTSVSSMTTTDSYVKKQLCLIEMKRMEREALRQEQEQAGLEGHYFDEGHNIEDETVVMEDEESYFPSSFCSSRDDQSLNDATSHHVSNSRRRSNTSNNRTPSNNSSQPFYQREECCIKHPHVRLSDQTDINVWTCMMYCKDSESGRWHTVKMVCEECFAEDEDYHCGDTPYHRRFRRDLQGFRGSQKGHRHHKSNLDRSSLSTTDDDVTCSTSSQYNMDEYNHHNNHHRETVNVLPMDGDGRHGNQPPLEREAEAQKRRFVRRLAARANHFPGNTWCEDWVQYTSNTHLVFGIFFHHPLHPVRSRERVVILLGSVAVGLLLSNLIYLWFVHVEFGMDDTVLSLGPNGSLDVTKLMITLWTLGSVVHTLFDLSIWHIKACTLCRYGHGNYVSDDAVKCGRTAGVTIVLVTLALATYLVLLRASEDYKDGYQVADGDDNDENNEVGGESFIQPISLGGGSAQYFDFLYGYIIEFILAVFVYNPLILTIVFTGVLGCNGRIPIVGGRPRELMREQRYAMKRQRYTMPQVLKLGDEEYEADMWGDRSQKLATNF